MARERGKEMLAGWQVQLTVELGQEHTQLSRLDPKSLAPPQPPNVSLRNVCVYLANA